MSDKIVELNKVDRPDTVALINALEETIEGIAPGKMTYIEVIGCLEFVKANYTRYMQEQ